MARQFVWPMAREFAGREVEDAALLLVSELATSAVCRSVEPIWVTVAADVDQLRVEVEDGSSDGESQGPGLWLSFIDRLADRWGTGSCDVGHTVWFELDTTAT